MAMVPESELMNPTFTLLPDVSTQELPLLAVELAEAGSEIWLPQPARAVAIAAAARGIKARLVTETLMFTCFSLRAASRQLLVSRVLSPMFFNVVTNIEDFIIVCCSLAEAREFLAMKF
jgi:hypothetical protein